MPERYLSGIVLSRAEQVSLEPILWDAGTLSYAKVLRHDWWDSIGILTDKLSHPVKINHVAPLAERQSADSNGLPIDEIRFRTDLFHNSAPNRAPGD